LAELITCGHGPLTIVDAESGEPRWSLDLREHPDVPAPEREWIAWYGGTVDECKPVHGGTCALVTSVAGLVGIVDIERRAVRRAAWQPGAHSAELLPDDLIAVAVSGAPGVPPGAPDGTGNALVLCDPGAPGEVLWRDDFPRAHGVVWDEGRGYLWALGYEELRAYRPNGEGLALDSALPLPGPGGHDLAPVPGADAMLLTTRSGVWTFERESGSFSPHPQLGEVAAVKSVSVHPGNGRLAYVQAEPLEAYSRAIRFAGEEESLQMDRSRYKARWLA